MSFTRKFGIVNRGVLLVSIPLVIQIALFATQFVLISKTQKLQREEAHRAEIVLAIDSYLSLMLQSWSPIMNSLTTSSQFKVIDRESFFRKTTSAMTNLRNLTVNDPALARRVASLSETTLMMLKFFDQTRTDKEQSSFDTLKLIKSIRPTIHELGVKEVEMMQSLQNIEAEQRAIALERTRLEDTVKTITLIGFICDSLFVPAVLWLFLGGLKKRIFVLLKNAKELPSRNPVLERITGDDEIHFVNEALFDAATRLKTADETRSGLIRMIAHDIRSPITSANLLLGTIIQNNANHIEPLLEQLSLTLRRVNTLVEDFLFVEKHESGVSMQLVESAVNSAELINEAVALVQPYAQARSIKITCEIESIDFLGDKDRLSQVMVNLLSNAIKHPKDGAVIKVSNECTQKEVIFRVQNTNSDLPKNAEKLFDQFRQGEHAGKVGFGLGLFISKSIIIAHGGSIGANKIGDWTNFWFSLPLETEDD